MVGGGALILSFVALHWLRGNGSYAFGLDGRGFDALREHSEIRGTSWLAHDWFTSWAWPLAIVSVVLTACASCGVRGIAGAAVRTVAVACGVSGAVLSYESFARNLGDNADVGAAAGPGLWAAVGGFLLLAAASALTALRSGSRPSITQP